MPPTIIVTVGSAALELAPPLDAAVPPPVAGVDVDVLLPDEQAATVTAVAHATANAAAMPRREPILRIVLLLCFIARGKKVRGKGCEKPQTADASAFDCGRQASSRRSS